MLVDNNKSMKNNQLVEKKPQHHLKYVSLLPWWISTISPWFPLPTCAEGDGANRTPQAFNAPNGICLLSWNWVRDVLRLEVCHPQSFSLYQFKTAPYGYVKLWCLIPVRNEHIQTKTKLLGSIEIFYNILQAFLQHDGMCGTFYWWLPEFWGCNWCEPVSWRCCPACRYWMQFAGYQWSTGIMWPART